MKSFHEEFIYFCRLNGDNEEAIPSLSTFKRAFRSQRNVKLAGCKGHFSSCEICNNGNDLLRDKGFYFVYI